MMTTRVLQMRERNAPTHPGSQAESLQGEPRPTTESRYAWYHTISD